MTDDFELSQGLSPEQCQPTSMDLDLAKQVLTIEWADGVTSRLPAAFLRSRCPCASCRTQRGKQSKTLLPVLTPAQSARPTAVGGSLMGHYALQLAWSDGHNTGIFDFRLLRALAAELTDEHTDPAADSGTPQSP